MVIEPEVPPEHQGKEKIKIGEDVCERLDVEPPRFRVIVTRRPKYAFKDADGVIQAPAPAHIIEGGIPTEALLAMIAVSKYADGLPLYRQEAIYARDRVELDRSLMAQWMGRLGFELELLSEHVLLRIKQGSRDLCRRNEAADAGARRRQDQDSLFMGLCERRSTLWRRRSADGRLSFRGQSFRRLRFAASGGLSRHLAGGWLRRLSAAGGARSRRRKP